MGPKKLNVEVAYCGKCSVIVREGTSSIQCTDCRLWFHHKCTNLSTADFRNLANRIKKGEAAWHCYPCESEVSVRTFGDLLEEDDKRDPMGNLDSLLDKHFVRFTKQYEQKFEAFRSEITSNLADIRAEVNVSRE
ncbi:uncharacterized protein LOC129245908 [Anastrepha obliqua]|uniref:uncharacterized protein LOC129245908 n=1 Tax=Anastrepha obliqua TaxID=95512 RepID=UPI0024099F7F|nr:uncharacterized protein LOC129245908 [Anastrepha obliqua]